MKDTNNMNNSFWRRTSESFSNLPLMIWVWLGFFITFILFFVWPVFLNSSLTMQFYQYIPIISPIGNDFRVITAAVSAWLHTGNMPPILYPSFTFIFFAPFTYLPLEMGYKIITIIILVCYVLITLILPQLINRSKEISALTVLIFITGILSYGFQFEMERGQWNLIAFAFCLAAIYLFHNQPRYRWLAYLLFTISIQLKLYPAIFVFTFIDDWRDWKQNIKRMIGLGLLNIVALFILGLNPILNTLHSLNSYDSTFVTTDVPFNLSLKSFTLFFLATNPFPFLFPVKHRVTRLLAHSWIVQLGFIVFFALCFLIILWKAYRNGWKGFNSYIFLACTVGAYILPSISYDYKLSFFPACIMLTIPNIFFIQEKKKAAIVGMLAFIFSIAYSSTLYSYISKPPIAQNDFPALLIILAISTILSLISSNSHSKESSSALDAKA